jgi:type VI secretion system protein ImpF
MAKAPELPVIQSVLDRLSSTRDLPRTRAESIAFFRDSIRRNLEWLLNSRRPPIDSIEDYPFAQRSVLNYGLVDIASFSLASSTDQRRLIENIAELVRNFEPRLTNVNVFLEEQNMLKKEFRFHIEARMQMKPMPEEIAFTTVLDLATGQYQVG